MKINMLYVVPVMPNPTGGGREMRAFTWIMHLQEKHVIHLVVAMPECEPSASLHRIVASIHFIPPVIEHKRIKIFQFLLFVMGFRKTPPIPHTITADAEYILQISEALRQFNIDYILVFRAGMFKLGLKFCDLIKPHKLDLDIDDIESSTHLSLARIRLKNHHFLHAAHEFIRSRLFFYAERATLIKFDNIYACSPDDQQYLSLQYNLKNVRLFPNQVLYKEIVPAVLSQPVFLFVGSLDYYPNEDAVMFLARHILPGLNKSMPGPFEIIVAGRNAPRRLVRFLRKFKEIKYLGEVKDMNPVYQKACIAIIPLRAGGGTKLKVLEAFLHKIPVIASGEAVRGLDVVEMEHYLPASTAKEFISACCRLSNDPVLSNNLRNRAYQWVLKNHVYFINQ